MPENKPALLIIDDEKDNLDALSRLLRNDFALITTTSPIDGLKLIQQRNFAVVLSDQRMPDMTGVELFEKMTQIKSESIRILLTGYTDIESVIDAINRGQIYRYIAKPWDPNDLKLTLKQAAEAYGLRQELAKKNQELEQLNLAKSRFLSLVSHEFKTPITVLSSFTELLGETTQPAEREKMVENLKKAVERLNQMVNEMLSYVQIETQSTLKKEWTDLKTYFQKWATSAIEIQGELSTWVDPTRFQLMAEYLMKDLLVLADKKKKLLLNLTQKGIEITGGGIEWKPALFQPLDTAGDLQHHTRRLGLSLAIVKLVVESHGGKITIDTPERLTIELPRAGN